jgi:hypothetical protein
MSSIIPPPPRQPPRVDAAEFIALRTIVMSLVAIMADQHEASGLGTAQGWINHIAAGCQEWLLAADIEASDPERIRREAVEHVNHILGGVRFPGDRDNSN